MCWMRLPQEPARRFFPRLRQWRESLRCSSAGIPAKTEGSKSFARDFAVIEVDGTVAKNLVGLVAFARKDHDVPRVGFFDCFANGRGAVRLHEEANAGDVV